MPQTDIEWAVEDVRGRLSQSKQYVDYYEGRHRLVFATEKFRNTFGDLFREFADNMCDDVVDEPVTRLKVLGWSGPSEAVNQQVSDWWKVNKGPARARVTHRNAFLHGDAFVMVWPDSKGKARLYPQCSDHWAVKYDEDEPDRIELAAKVWREGKVYRCTLYYDLEDGSGRIERYRTKGLGASGGIPKASAFLPYTEPDDEDGGPGQAAVETHNWGMPVFHFPVDEVGRYGRSVLPDVICVQDALNKAVSDMLVAMEAVAYPQRWATGVQIEKGPDGKEINPFEGGANRVIYSGSKDAAFGTFTQGDMSGFLEVQDSLRLEIARKGYLPPYSVNLRASSGGAPSGISLLISDGRQIKRCLDAIEVWEQTWCAATALALRMDGVAVEAEDLNIEWDEVSTRDEKALIETLLMKKELGVSERRLLLEAGYTEDEIQEMQDEAEVEAQDAQAANDAMGFGKMGKLDQASATGLADQLGLPDAPDGPSGANKPNLAA